MTILLALIGAVIVAGILWQPHWRLPDWVGEWAGVGTAVLISCAV